MIVMFLQFYDIITEHNTYGFNVNTTHICDSLHKTIKLGGGVLECCDNVFEIIHVYDFLLLVLYYGFINNKPSK